MRLHYHFDVPEDKRLELSLIQMQNEADDQFAIVQAILTPKFRLEGIVAAHYKAGFAALVWRRSCKRFHDAELC